MGRRRAPSLKRSPAKREPKSRFVIFCEGEKTEPGYFSAIRAICSDALIVIEMEKAAGVPYTIAKSAVAHVKGRKKKALALYEKGDQIWVAFDRDQHPRFSEAVNLCRQHGIGVAQSNPCFELWLILHIEDFDRSESRHKVQKYLETIRDDYSNKNKTLNFDELLENVAFAEERGEKQLVRRRDERNANGNPSTTVGELTSAIREAARKAQG